MSAYLGDFRIGKAVRKCFNTNAIAGESITIATNGTVSCYKDGGTTQSTTGITFTEDFDSLTGVHLVAVDTSADGTFYSAGSDFEVVLSAATIDGKTINATLFSFSLEARSALMPTTDGRKLDVSAGGEAGLDWANVGSPTTTLALTGTTVATTQKVDVETIKTQAVTCAAGVTVPALIASTTNITAGTITTATNVTTVNGLAAGVITAAAIATDAIDADALAADAVAEIQSGLATAANLATVAGYLDTEIAAILADTNELQTDWVDGGRLDLILDARASQTSVDDLPTNAELATSQASADDATLAAIAALNNLSAAQVNAECDTAIADAALATAANLATVAGYIDTEVAAILAAVDTEVAAIKAKTDNLPASPAAVGSAMTLTSGERDSIASALLDLADAVETGITPRGTLRLMLASLAGKLSGAATATITIRNVGDSKDRITATVDADGNRTAVTTDAS